MRELMGVSLGAGNCHYVTVAYLLEDPSIEGLYDP